MHQPRILAQARRPRRQAGARVSQLRGPRPPPRAGRRPPRRPAQPYEAQRMTSRLPQADVKRTPVHGWPGPAWVRRSASWRAASGFRGVVRPTARSRPTAPIGTPARSHPSYGSVARSCQSHRPWVAGTSAVELVRQKHQVDEGPSAHRQTSRRAPPGTDGPGQSHCSSARELTGCGLPMTARAMKKLIWPIAMVRVASAFSS